LKYKKVYGAQIGRPHIGFGLVISKDSYMPVMGYPVRGSNIDYASYEIFRF
jgi:hypothetical protein